MYVMSPSARVCEPTAAVEVGAIGGAWGDDVTSFMAALLEQAPIPDQTGPRVCRSANRGVSRTVQPGWAPTQKTLGAIPSELLQGVSVAALEPPPPRETAP